MISVGNHPLELGVADVDVPAWARPVFDAGRDAAFVDTGYLLGLLDDHDSRHDVTVDHWSRSRAISYTSAFVAAETVRHLAKRRGGHIDQKWRWEKVARAKRLTIDEEQVIVFSPGQEIVVRAFQELHTMNRSLTALDLCDSVSMVVLDVLNHRRVFGFDDHFRSVGAALEPTA